MNETNDAVLQYGNIEVDQESDLPLAEAEIGEQLGFVKGRDAFHVFQFQIQHTSILPLCVLGASVVNYAGGIPGTREFTGYIT
jgi:hypothetical protein